VDDRTLRVAIIGAGPAGIYAADLLTKSDRRVAVDVIEKLPTPYGLIRYGVAPDHPRIKEIVKALRLVLAHPDVRFLGNVTYGVDIKLEDLRTFYDAVVFATGAMEDRDLGIPGEELPGCFGAADFVAWYDGHPDAKRSWPLDAREVAVIGAGNVALDVARVLAKTADELAMTDVPDAVLADLRNNRATDVHIFARRGPAQSKFSPMELREISHSPNIDVVVHPEGFEMDEASLAAVSNHKQTKMVVDTLQNWVVRDPVGRPHRIHLHFLEQPVAISGAGRVQVLRTERTRLNGDGTVTGTGCFTDWPVDAVYRAVGYRSASVADLPFDDVAAVVPNRAGRVLDPEDVPLPGIYVTGWIKRGPVGLIGHTKSDAAETVASLLEDACEQPHSVHAGADSVLAYLTERGVAWTTIDGWYRIDDREVAIGREQGRERVKIVERSEMLEVATTTAVPAAT